VRITHYLMMLATLCCALATCLAADKPLPARDNYWWNTCTSFVVGAANHFKMNVSVYYAERSRDRMIAQARSALESKAPPDFILLPNMKMAAPTIIEMAAKRKVKVLLFNSGLTDDERGQFGRPREKFANWIGEIIPDDVQAGYDLADFMVKQAKAKGLARSDGKVEMLALGGVISDTSAIDRNTGLERYLAEHPQEAVLDQNHVLPADWESARAQTVFGAAYRIFPNARAIWAANDLMAMGVLQHLQATAPGRVGQSVLVGGIDWNPGNLAAIKNGQLAASLGGHFTEGAWAVVMIHDYASGVDFKDSGVSLRSTLALISADNIARFERALANRTEDKINRINYSKFSRADNPALKAYTFTPDALLSELK
jgi:ABC-type sugar transport system substrate-binding protein